MFYSMKRSLFIPALGSPGLRHLRIPCIFICYGALLLGVISSVMHSGVSLAQAPSVSDIEITRAEELARAGNIDLAIQSYEHILGLRALKESQRGVSHMRLGRLYIQKLNSEAATELAIELNARAAYHFLRCEQSQGLDDIFRIDICGAEVRQRLAPLKVRGPVESIIVKRPEAFSGRLASSGLLPRGMVSLEVMVRGKLKPEYRVVSIPQSVPLDFTTYNYMPPQPRIKNPSQLILYPSQGRATRAMIDYSQLQEVQSHSARKPPRTLGYIFTGIGLAALGAGAIISASDIIVPLGREEGMKWILVGGGAFILIGSSWLVYTW